MNEGCELAVGAREIVEVGRSGLCGRVARVGGCGGEDRLGGSGLVDCMCSCGCLGWRVGGFDSNGVGVVWGLGEDWMGLLAGVWLTGLGLVGFLVDSLLGSVLCRLLFSSVVVGPVSNSLSMFVFSMSASSSSKVSGWRCWSVLVVGLDSDGFVLISFVFVAEVVVDILGEEMLSVVVVGVIVVIVLSVIVVISLRTLEVVVVAPRPLIPRFSAIKKQRRVLLSSTVVCV